jgi:hypothetical protein
MSSMKLKVSPFAFRTVRALCCAPVNAVSHKRGALSTIILEVSLTNPRLAGAMPRAFRVLGCWLQLAHKIPLSRFECSNGPSC